MPNQISQETARELLENTELLRDWLDKNMNTATSLGLSMLLGSVDSSIVKAKKEMEGRPKNEGQAETCQ